FALQRDPIPQSAEIIPQMHVAGWLSSAKNSFHLTLNTDEQNRLGNRQHHPEDHSEDTRKHG
ncbi:MAG: hypothetical protein QOI77_3752, partial [Blastocatellia bacterium]|nr:hypothetical protein [Blastocatellia bacterium]